MCVLQNSRIVIIFTILCLTISQNLLMIVVKYVILLPRSRCDSCDTGQILEGLWRPGGDFWKWKFEVEVGWSSLPPDLSSSFSPPTLSMSSSVEDIELIVSRLTRFRCCGGDPIVVDTGSSLCICWEQTLPLALAPWRLADARAEDDECEVGGL